MLQNGNKYMFDKLLTKEEIKKCKKLHLKKGEILFKENEKCDSVFLLLEGEILISSSDIDGNEEIYNYLKSGDMIANILVFAKNNTFLGDAIAQKNTTILQIKKDILLEILKNNNLFLDWFLSYNSNETMESKIKAKLLSKRSIKDRIIYYLTINGGIIDESVTSISKKIMINRVCVSRIISDLEKQNIIKRKGKTIIYSLSSKRFINS